LRGGRGADDGDQERRRVLRIRLYLRVARAVLRASRLWRQRGSRAHVDPVRDRAVQHGGGGRLRGPLRGRAGTEAARDVAPLRDGQGRDRSLEDRVGGPLAAWLQKACKNARSESGLDAS